MTMKCPQCGEPSEVLETRAGSKGWGHLRRRRECALGHRFTTEETAVISKDGGKPMTQLPFFSKTKGNTP